MDLKAIQFPSLSQDIPQCLLWDTPEGDIDDGLCDCSQVHHHIVFMYAHPQAYTPPPPFTTTIESPRDTLTRRGFSQGTLVCSSFSSVKVNSSTPLTFFTDSSPGHLAHPLATCCPSRHLRSSSDTRPRLSALNQLVKHCLRREEQRLVNDFEALVLVLFIKKSFRGNIVHTLEQLVSQLGDILSRFNHKGLHHG